jgi:hypothetical protein
VVAFPFIVLVLEGRARIESDMRKWTTKRALHWPASSMLAKVISFGLLPGCFSLKFQNYAHAAPVLLHNCVGNNNILGC